jgi:DNA-binding response OmpR family regulator
MSKQYILIAEDDPFYTNFYKRKLGKDLYDIDVVSNGKVLLSALEKKIPDLILLDLIMPVMDGFSVLTEMGKDKRFKSIKTIVMTNLGQDEDRKRALGLGAQEYLVKSDLSIDEMINVIKKYLQ